MPPSDSPRLTPPTNAITFHPLKTNKAYESNQPLHLEPHSENHRYCSHRRCRRIRNPKLYVAMRTISLLIVHCSATPEGKSLSAEACRQNHIRHRGFRDIGYHFYITRDGKIHNGRPLEEPGAHCLHHNRHSIGICYEGGLDAEGHPKDTRTLAQRASLLALLRELRRLFPQALIVGHHDLNPQKACPSFHCAREYIDL